MEPIVTSSDVVTNSLAPAQVVPTTNITHCLLIQTQSRIINEISPTDVRRNNSSTGALQTLVMHACYP